MSDRPPQGDQGSDRLGERPGQGTAHGAARDRSADPLGKRALFSPPADRATGPAGADATPPPPAGEGHGRQALFSGRGIGPRSVVVECARCGDRTPVGVAALARQLVPSLWRPGRRFSRYMRCPGCGRFGWCRLDWSVFRAL